MSRLALLVVLASSVAHADVADDPDWQMFIFEQGLGAGVGVAGGGHITPGGLRIEGHYTYQLSEHDWFDGIAAFTFGGGGAACFRDRMDEVICDHGFTDGRGVEVVAAVRRYFETRGKYTPFARLGVGIGIARFGDDDVTGLTIPLHAGGGIRAVVADDVAIVATAELVIGFGRFNQGLGLESQLGLAITAGAELRLP